MIDPDEGWSTERLDLQPLDAGHADEMFLRLNDRTLHEYVGDAPLSRSELREWYERLAGRRSPDGRQVWCNWVLRERSSGDAVGTLQATLPAPGPAAGPAEVAWVVARRWQRRGYASEAAASLVTRLELDGWLVVAHIHPGHVASQAVARSAGLRPTDLAVDGEVEWSTRPR